MLVNLLAVVLVALACYLGWWSLAFSAPLWWCFSLVSLVVAIGLFLRKRWAQHAWHAVALCVSLAWAFSVVRVAIAGWPYTGIVASAVSLLPGALLLIVCGGGSFVVATEYGRKLHAL